MLSLDDTFKISGFLLGLIGSILGIYNYNIAKKERKLKIQVNYAKLLFVIDDILNEIVQLPFGSIEQYKDSESPLLADEINKIESAIDAQKDKILDLVPEIAADIIHFKYASRNLANLLNGKIHQEESSSIPREFYLILYARNYIGTAMRLAIYRSYSPAFKMELFDQMAPSTDNWSGDGCYKSLQGKHELFNNRLLELKNG